jgi:uncharacterized membrane protein
LTPWRTRTPDWLLLAVLAGAVALVLRTLAVYPPVSLALVVASLVLAGASLWSCRVLLGARTAWTFLALAAATGWFAEETGANLGWFFGDHYTYTEVLGPRLLTVPLVIPLMWFGLCYIGWLMACLTLWRAPVPPAGGWRRGALAALLAAMIVTAFDLGADPYFVYVLKAWIMDDKQGGWFGETLRGFTGWMVVSFAIVALFQALARPRLLRGAADARARRAALVPVLVYFGFIAFQVTQTQPAALRVVALFAMGIPAMLALVAWSQWAGTPQGREGARLAGEA